MASAEEVVEPPSEVLVSEAEVVLVESVAVDVAVRSVAVESVAVESVAVESVAVDDPVSDAEVTVPVVVPVAPTMPKLGEKLMLVGSESSMISMVYWKVLTWEASTVKVAVPSEAGMPA